MKLLLLTTFVATICCQVNAGKTQKLLAAMLGMNTGRMAGMNPGMMAGMNPGMMAGMNPGMMAGMNPGMMAGMNPGLMAGMNPGMLAGGLNPAMVAGGGAGFIGQPQFVQFVQRVPAFAAPAPIANVYAVPAVNGFPFMGVPQGAQMNPPQQPQMGVPGGAMQQQVPLQADPFRRFRRQNMKQDNTLKATVDTQLFSTIADWNYCKQQQRILRLNGLTLATLGQTQGSSILPQYVFQQQRPEVLFPQMVNFNPQLANPFGPQGPQLFFPNQGNQLTPMMFPNGQQEQLGPPQDPNAPEVPQQAQNPFQMFPQFQYPSYGFPQFPRQQGYPYFMPPYGYPQQRNTVVTQPNNGQQQRREPHRDHSSLCSSLPSLRRKLKKHGQWGQRERIDEGNSNFPFLFEP
ncbi:Methionine-rich protein [Dissostichus eleginoides]|uniref:Methionine-rich protein n=1 Tax=Dissostichus eleginoides TaxID=100907 RepID=A0AAD9BNS6_DISEL|nr:Methionine-rich protein [Dissostichus eleginoides]